MLELTSIEKFAISVLRQGRIPNHIAFIMDGNRRYARFRQQEVYKGHQQGKQSLKHYLLYCLELGVHETSFFCFSLENFKRSETEVNKLMELVMETFSELSEVSEFVLKTNTKVKIVGNLQLFRQDVQECLKKIQEKTKNHSKMTVNLCFAYDSIDEVSKAVEKVEMSKDNQKNKESIVSQISKHLMIISEVDIMVRTSNESRLSNFMLMQCPYSLILILKENWPEVGLLSLAKILFHFNYHYNSLEKKKRQWEKELQIKNREYRESQFQLDEQNKKIIGN